MSITNFVITANGAGYAESDGLNPIASTVATAVIKNDIVSIVLSDDSSWKNTPLEFCTLNGVALSTDTRIAIDQLALAGFSTAPGGSGAGVNSFNGKTGVVEYPLFKESDGTTNSDSYSEEIRHNGDIVLSGNSNNILTRMLKYDQGDFGAIIDDFGLFEARRDGDTVNGLEWGAIYAALSPNDQKPALTLLTQQLNETAKTVGTLLNIVNNTEELFKIVAGGQVTFNNYGVGTFQNASIDPKIILTDSSGNLSETDNTFISGSQWIKAIPTTSLPNGGSINLLTLISEADKVSLMDDSNQGFLNINNSSFEMGWRGVQEKLSIRINVGVSQGGTDSLRFRVRKTIDDSIISVIPFVVNSSDVPEGLISVTTVTYIGSPLDDFVTGGFYIDIANDSGGGAANINTSLNIFITRNKFKKI